AARVQDVGVAVAERVALPAQDAIARDSLLELGHRIDEPLRGTIAASAAAAGDAGIDGRGIGAVVRRRGRPRPGSDERQKKNERRAPDHDAAPSALRVATRSLTGAHRN